MPTALPSPTAARTGTMPGGKPASFDKMKAAYQRAMSVKEKFKEKQELMVGGLVATTEIQAATFTASFLSGWMAKKGKSMKVMGLDTRVPVAAAMIIPGLWMENGGQHLLALGNGVLASATSEWAFDLGARMATPKEERSAKKEDKAGEDESGDDDDDGSGDSPPVSLSGDGIGEDEYGARGRGRGRRLRRIGRRGRPPEDEPDEEDETGAVDLGRLALALLTGGGSEAYRALTPANKVKVQFNAYKRALKRYKIASAKGNEKGKNRWKSKMAFHKAEGLRLYKKFKGKKGVTLPAAWKAKKKPAAEPAADEGTTTVRRTIIRRAPSDEEVVEEEFVEDEAQDADAWTDEDSDTLDEVVSNLSDDELQALAGVAEELADGTIDPDEFANDSDVEEDDTDDDGFNG